MDVIFVAVEWQHALVYLDDSIIYFKCPEYRTICVCRVSNILKDTANTIRLKQCKFFTETINYLSHVIRPSCEGIVLLALGTIRGLQLLTNLTEMKPFLNLCNVLRRFIPNIARIAALSIQSLCRDQPSAFRTLDE